MGAPAQAPARTLPPAHGGKRPLFGGYALVASVAAWVAGTALRGSGLVGASAPLSWLAVAAGGAVLAGAIYALARWRPFSRGRLRRLTSLVLIALIVLVWLALGAARAAAADPSAGPHSVAHLPYGVTLELRGDVVAEPALTATGRLLTVDVTQASRDSGASWEPGAGRIEVSVNGPDDWFTPDYGDTLELTGKLEGFTHGAPAGVLARLTSAQVHILARGGGNPLAAFIFALRVRIAEGIQRALPEPEASLLIGILLGLKTPTLRARLALFTSTGTIHLVVPAGLKVSLLADLARHAAAPLGRWTGTAAALVSVVGYAALGGGGPAAVRAAIMGALLVLGPALGRRYDVYSALAIAVLLMTAVDPLLVFDAGFQLTALATAGIPLLAPHLARWLRAPLERLRHPRFSAGLSAAWAPVAELLAVTLAAQLATLPVIGVTFGVVAVVAPLANLLAVPLLAPLLVLGALVALVALAAPALAPLAGFAAWPLLWVMNRVIEVCAALPGAAFTVASVPPWLAWVYYALLVAAMAGAILLRRRRTAERGTASVAPMPVHATSGSTPRLRAVARWALAGLAALILLASFGATVPALAAPRGAIAFLNVGAGGEATLLRLASGVTVLIDGGASGPALEEALTARLPFWQRSLDLAVLTDPSAGDETGLQDASTHYAIGQAVDGGMLHPSTVYLAWLDALARSGATHTRVRQDDVIHLDGATTLRVLSPPQTLFPPGNGTTSTSDDLVLRLDTPGLRVLFLGNADAYALDALAFAGEPLDADVVELALPPATGLNLDSPLGKVVLAAHPRLVVITQAPKAAHPAPHIGATPADIWPPDAPTAQSLGAVIMRTSDAGTITLAQRTDGGWDAASV